MPNRMLRDWTGSDKINELSVHAERFFTRLIMKVDDHGCFYADTRLLKANLFPLLLDQIREADLLRWMAECQKAGLIVLYEVANKKYVQIVDFGQRLRQKVLKFPLPEDDSTMRADDSNPPPEVEVEEKGRGSAAPDLSKSNLFRQPNIPTFEQVHEVFIRGGGTKEMAQKFFEGNQGVGWYHKNSPITNFANFVPGFIESWRRNEKKTNPVDTKKGVYV